MDKILYTEEQKFSNPGLWIFTTAVFTIAIAPEAIAIFKVAFLDQQSGKGDESLASMIVLLLVLLAMFIATIILFRYMKLVIEVRSDGLYYKYPPFILKMTSFRKGEIENFKVRTYKPIREFSGWGIKYSWTGAGRAITVKGKTGLQLYLKNGKKVLLGTQRGDALLRAMHKMMKEE